MRLKSWVEWESDPVATAAACAHISRAAGAPVVQPRGGKSFLAGHPSVRDNRIRAVTGGRITRPSC